MSLGSARGGGHPGSQNDLEHELVGADPSVGGLPRPVGWRVQLATGTAAWDKTGTGDTDWTPVGSLVGVTKVIAGTGVSVSPPGGTGNVTVGNTGVLQVHAGTNVTVTGTAQDPIVNAAAAGVTSLVAGDPGITITNPTGPAVTVGQVNVAQWTVGRTRVYAVDPAGDDNNVGFADMAGTTAADYATACAAAGAVAKKTLAGLAAIFPKDGAGRLAEIVIRSATYTDSIELVLNGTFGYANNCPTVRGTDTIATAGCTAFDGSAADCTAVGMVTCTGLNAAGYNPTVAATTSTVPGTKVGGGSPAFAAEPAVPLGWRIRFDSATATAALRNICRQVCEVSGADTVLLQTALPAVPAVGDVYYLEQAGVVVPALTLQGAVLAGTGTTGMALVGIRSSGTLTTGPLGNLTVVGCGCNVWNHSGLASLVVQQFYNHPVRGALTIGGGMRSETTGTFTGARMTFVGLVTGTSLSLNNPNVLTWGAGCASRSLGVLQAVLGQIHSTQANPQIGVAAAIAVGIPHLFGAGTFASLFLDGCRLVLGAMKIINAGALPAIGLNGISKLIFKAVISGSSGNTDVGLDLQNSIMAELELRAGALPTVTGTAGDLRFANQALGVWTNLNFEEAYDQACNHVFEGNTNGAAYPAAMNPSVANGVHVNAGGADAAYTVMRSNGTSGQVTPAQANNAANAAGIQGVLLAAANNGAACLYGGISGYKVVQFDGAPVVGAIAYLSPGTAGNLTTTVPPLAATNQKLRVGRVVNNAYPGNLALVAMTPEVIPVLADGLP